MTGYAVATDGLNGKTLFMVDRRCTKDRWWTEECWALAMRFKTDEAAQKAASRLIHNNPRVVTWEEAEAVMEEQSSSSIDCSPWDDHKNY